MCGRFAYFETEDLEERFPVTRKRGIRVGASYNVAPGQIVPIIHSHNDEIVVDSMRWGYLPSWAKDQRMGYRMINARDDTVETKPAWRGGLKHGRCLIPANGFYEWKTEAGKKVKQPYFIRIPEMSTFAMAGICTVWLGPDGREIPTFAIITTSASREMEDIHDRMPVIVSRHDERAWLSSESSLEMIRSIMMPRHWTLECIPVGHGVNSVVNNESTLISRVTPA
ncbi:MAG: SOS response-associated peptidase [Candidatus Dormibacteria bacterium]